MKASRKSIPVIVIVVLAFAALACGSVLEALPFGEDEPSIDIEVPEIDIQPEVEQPAGEDAPSKEEPAVPAGGPGITVINNSQGTICYLYISGSDESTWGDDWLGGGTIAPGAQMVYDLDGALYDIKAEDCQNRIMHGTFGIDTSSMQTWIVEHGGGAEIAVDVENGNAAEVCYIKISPSTSDEWGQDWLGENETLPSGATRSFSMPAGTYDFSASDCNGNALYEDYEIPINAAYTWYIQ